MFFNGIKRYIKLLIFCISSIAILGLVYKLNERIDLSLRNVQYTTKPQEKLLKETFFKSECDCRQNSYVKLDKYETFYSIKLKNSNDNSTRLQYRINKNDFQNLNITCDLFSVFRRGRNQRVIGFSLYGQNRFYYDKLKNLTRLVKKLYPGWIMRVHYDDSIDKSIICEIQCQKDDITRDYIDNSDFCYMNRLKMHPSNLDFNFDGTYLHKMKWRWFPIGDAFVDIFSSRDSDSYLLQREVDSVNVWLKSNKEAHIMRDHPHHSNPFFKSRINLFNK